MAADEAVAQRARRTGLALIDPQLGLSGLHTVMSTLASPYAAAALVAAVPVEWGVLLRASKGAVPFFFADLAPESKPQLPSSQPQPQLLRLAAEQTSKISGRHRRDMAQQRAGSSRHRSRRHQRLEQPVEASASAGLSEESVQAAVLDVTASILGAQVAPTQPLMEAGLDSLGKCCSVISSVSVSAERKHADRSVIPGAGAVELRNALGSKFGVELPPTVIFDFPSVAALAGHLATTLAVPSAPALLGMSGDFQPGDLSDDSSASDGEHKPARASRHGGHRRGQTGRTGGAGAISAAAPSAAELEASILGQLASLVESVLGASVGPHQPLMEAGLDSLGEGIH